MKAVTRISSWRASSIHQCAKALGGAVTIVQTHASHLEGSRRRRTHHWLPALLVAAAVAGCGSSATKTNSTTAATTTAATTTSSGSSPASMITSAEAICERASALVAAHSTTTILPKAIAKAAYYLGRVEQNAVNELAKLEAPATIAHDWQQLLADRRTLAADLAKLGHYEERSDFAKVHVVGPAMRALQQNMLTLGQSAGVKACAQVK
jgi:hypothetical protein